MRILYPFYLMFCIIIDMFEFFMKMILYPFIWMYYMIPHYLRNIWNFLQMEVKLDVNTFIGIGLSVYFYLILSGKIDHFQAFRRGMDVVAHEGSPYGGGEPLVGILIGVPLILLGRGTWVFIGYCLIAIQWLIMVSFENPKPLRPHTNLDKALYRSHLCSTRTESNKVKYPKKVYQESI